jgi:hypothetical protein
MRKYECTLQQTIRKLSLLAGVLVLAGPAFAGAGSPVRDAAYKLLDRFFGTLTGSYIIPDAAVKDQVGAAMGIPRPDLLLPDGSYLVSGCRPRSCDEKGAVVVGPGGEITAAALISHKCNARAASACLPYPNFTVFVPHGQEQAAHVRALQEWARETLIPGDLKREFDPGAPEFVAPP